MQSASELRLPAAIDLLYCINFSFHFPHNARWPSLFPEKWLVAKQSHFRREGHLPPLLHCVSQLGAKWSYFKRRYKHPRLTAIWCVLTRIDTAELDRITGTWILAQARKRKDDDGNIQWVIAIDGKVMRGAWTDENDKVTLFSAMLQEEGVTIAQVRVPDGTNETTQVKALAQEFGIAEGESVPATFDAGHCNKEQLIPVERRQVNQRGNRVDSPGPNARTRVPGYPARRSLRCVTSEWPCFQRAH
jgi:hypothetical protein